LRGFKIKRFFILNGKKNDLRGNHVHKKCTQIFIPINGSFELSILNKSQTKNFVLNGKRNFSIYVKPLNCCKIKFKENNSSILVLFDYKSIEKEYIRNLTDYLKFINKV